MDNLKAYSIVEETSGEYSGGVYFAKSPIHARRAAANEWNDGELGGLRLRREPGLDQYAKTRNIPLFEMIDRGWWTQCDFCGSTINSDLYDEEGRENSAPCGFFSGASYCDEKCQHDQGVFKERSREALYEIEQLLKRKVHLYFDNPVFVKGQAWEYVVLHQDVPFVRQLTVSFVVDGATAPATLSYERERGKDPVCKFCIAYDRDHFKRACIKELDRLFP